MRNGPAILEHRRARSGRTSGLTRVAAAVLAVAVIGCDVENPTAVTLETAEPLYLVRGVEDRLNYAAGSLAEQTFLASDEGYATGTRYQFEDNTGSLTLALAFRFQEMHQARRLAEIAVERAEATGDEEIGRLAHAWHGWVLTRLAQVWGAQPFDGEEVVPQEEIFARALASFEAAAASAVDSTRHRGLAGLVRIHWIQGHDPLDAGRLEAAIAAAQRVLDEDPEFEFVTARNYRSYWTGRAYTPTEPFAAVPIPIAGYPHLAGHDSSLVFLGKGIALIDADELRLIQAKAQLLLGDVAAAKATLKSTALLPVNHVHVGREPDDPPLAADEVDALIDPLDAAALMQAIDRLLGENQFFRGLRNIGPDGQPIFPIDPPEGA